MSKNTSLLYSEYYMNENRPNILANGKVVEHEILKARYNLGLALLGVGWMGGYQLLTRNKSSNKWLAAIRESKALRVALPFCVVIHVARWVAAYKH